MAPIPSHVIDETLAVLLNFKKTCEDFQVLDENIRVVATEATRNALNRDDLLHRIHERTGWSVQLLSKEQEGHFGSMGIASSVTHLDGICLDMGGGSVQITWVRKEGDGEIQLGPSVSLPYGAAALTSHFSHSSIWAQGQIQAAMASKIRTSLEKDLHIPPARWTAAEGFNLYLSGGGFRGWGYILMSQDDVQPYPISIINGYEVSETRLFSAIEMGVSNRKIFGISSRRAAQVPAVQAVLKAIKQTGTPISKAIFAQGGVREGILYSSLPASVRNQHPLVASTAPYAPRSASALIELLNQGVPYPIEPEVLIATVNLLYFHSPLSKDVRAAAALRSTTTGVLAGTHGLSHRDRWLLALILCERWAGDVSLVDDPFMHGLQELAGPLCWWTKFIGRIAKGIADIFPAGIMQDEQIVRIETGFPQGENASSTDRCWVRILASGEDLVPSMVAWGSSLEKLGQKKSWVSGRGGLKVDVERRVVDSIAAA